MSTTFSLTAGQLIVRAYRKIGNLQPPWTPDDDQLNSGLIALDFMLKGLQSNGTNLWRQTQVSWAIPAGQGTLGNPYEVTPIFLSLENARLVVQPAPNLYERPLGIYTYEQYMNLPNKLSKGSPSVIMFDRQSLTSNIYIFPLPINGCTVNASVARTINDVTMVSDPIDCPVEWTEGLIYMLADRLMDDGGVRAADPETAQSITAHAQAFGAKLLDFDRSDSVFIQPWGSTWNRRLRRY